MRVFHICVWGILITTGNKAYTQETVETVVVTAERIDLNQWSWLTKLIYCNYSLSSGIPEVPGPNWLTSYTGQTGVTNVYQFDYFTKTVRNLTANSGTKCTAPKKIILENGTKEFSCSASFGDIKDNSSVTLFDMLASNFDLNFQEGNYTLTMGSDETGRLGITTHQFETVSQLVYSYNHQGESFKVSVDPNNGTGAVTFGSGGTSFTFSGINSDNNTIEVNKTFSDPSAQSNKLEVRLKIGMNDGNFESIGMNFSMQY